MAYQHPIAARFERAGRIYTAEIARWEDWFFAGPDTPARREQCRAGWDAALLALQAEEAVCAAAWERERVESAQRRWMEAVNG